MNNCNDSDRVDSNKVDESHKSSAESNTNNNVAAASSSNIAQAQSIPLNLREDPAMKEPSIFSSQEATMKKLPAKKGNKTKRDNDTPRRPLSAYNMFFREQRMIILKERESQKEKGESTESGASLFSKMGKTIAKRWKELSSEEVTRFNHLAQEEKDRYQQEMNDYNIARAKKTKAEMEEFERDIKSKSFQSELLADGQDGIGTKNANALAAGNPGLRLPMTNFNNTQLGPTTSMDDSLLASIARSQHQSQYLHLHQEQLIQEQLMQGQLMQAQAQMTAAGSPDEIALLRQSIDFENARLNSLRSRSQMFAPSSFLDNTDKEDFWRKAQSAQSQMTDLGSLSDRDLLILQNQQQQQQRQLQQVQQQQFLQQQQLQQHNQQNQQFRNDSLQAAMMLERDQLERLNIMQNTPQHPLGMNLSVLNDSLEYQGQQYNFSQALSNHQIRPSLQSTENVRTTQAAGLPGSVFQQMDASYLQRQSQLQHHSNIAQQSVPGYGQHLQQQNFNPSPTAGLNSHNSDLGSQNFPSSAHAQNMDERQRQLRESQMFELQRQQLQFQQLQGQRQQQQLLELQRMAEQKQRQDEPEPGKKD